MGFIAISFLASTLGFLVATAWDMVSRLFRRRAG